MTGTPLMPTHAYSKYGKPAGRRDSNLLKYAVIALVLAGLMLLAYSHARFNSLGSSPAAPVLGQQQQPEATAPVPQPVPQPAQAPAPRPAVPTAVLHGKPEVWAAGPQKGDQQGQLLKLLDEDTLSQLKALCGRCLYRTLTSYVRMHNFGRITVVLTGDIPAMWLRDSAVQMASYFPRVGRRPAMRQVLEGAIRAQAYFVLQDPWANAYNPRYVSPGSLKKYDRQLGRGGWVWTRNFELDSVAYFFNFIWNYHQTPTIWQPDALLTEPLVHDAVVTMLKLLQVEQHHEKRSPYRYSELERDGLGSAVGYTGMVWSAFRASDDPQKYGYNIPDNMYLWGALKRLAELNTVSWKDPYIAKATQQLMADVHDGIVKYGIVDYEPGKKMYAYEVDGLGGTLRDFDDPNLPSLLALPLLGYDLYDAEVYKTTRARILSPANPYFYSGTELHGLGSPHTSPQHVWPLATAVEALTVDDEAQQLELLKMLLKMAHGNGLVHESVHVNQLSSFTRPEFGWANAMAVVAIENLLGVDCDEAAEKHRLQSIGEREQREPQVPANKGNDIAQYYEQLEASIIHE